MGLRSSDESGAPSPQETYDLMQRADRAESQRDAALAKLLDAEAEVVRLRALIVDDESKPCSYCGAGVDCIGVGCPICNGFRLGTTAAQPKEPT